MRASLQNTEFYHGLNGGMFGKEPVYLRGPHGYTFPILDIYDKRLGGLYLISQDTSHGLRGYDIIKKASGETPKVCDECYFGEAKANDLFEFDEGCGMAITYREVELGPGSEYVTPAVAVGVHPYRWERAWESYRAWR